MRSQLRAYLRQIEALMSRDATLTGVVRKVLREQDGDESGEPTRFQREMFVVSAVLVYQLINLVFLGVVAAVAELIKLLSTGQKLMREEILYAPQRDGNLHITVANKSTKPVRVLEAYGGFQISLVHRKPSDKIGSVQRPSEEPRTLGFYLGGGKKINVKSLMTSMPHPEALRVSMEGTVIPGDTAESIGSLAEVSYGIDPGYYQAPFLATHVKLDVGGQEVIVPVAATRDGTQVTAINDKIVRRKT